jgi:hypothetical protein
MEERTAKIHEMSSGLCMSKHVKKIQINKPKCGGDSGSSLAVSSIFGVA